MNEKIKMNKQKYTEISVEFRSKVHGFLYSENFDFVALENTGNLQMFRIIALIK